MSRIYQFLICLDQCLNVLVGSGFADETLSAYAWRKQGMWIKVIDTLFWFDKDHCYKSYLSEMYRKQYPKEYRRK